MTTENSVFDNAMVTPKRSSFLTVLCILSFIGSGFGIISGVNSYVTADKSAAKAKLQMSSADSAKIAQLKNAPDKQSQLAYKMMTSMGSMLDPQKLKQAGIAGLLTNLMTLGGALLMWQRRRTGFYLYVVGILASVATPIAIFGSGNIIAMLGAFIPGFFGLVFIVMYGFCLKEMK